jgi:hypothetical protein
MFVLWDLWSVNHFMGMYVYIYMYIGMNKFTRQSWKQAGHYFAIVLLLHHQLCVHEYRMLTRTHFYGTMNIQVHVRLMYISMDCL